MSRVRFSEFESFQAECAQLLRRWMITPTAYREAHASQTSDLAAFAGSAFNYVLLKTHPLIEARPGEFLIPVLPLLLTKVVDDPYYILCEALKDKTLRQFQQALGRAYEDYAQALVRRIF